MPNNLVEIITGIQQLLNNDGTLVTLVSNNIAYGRLPDETPLPGIIYQIVYIPILNTFDNTNLGPVLGKVQFDVYTPYYSGAVANAVITDALFSAINRKDIVLTTGMTSKTIGKLWADDRGMLSQDDKAYRNLIVFNLLTN